MSYVTFYRTRDRFSIYILLASGCEVDGYEHEIKGVYFRFADKDKCEAILSKHLARKLKLCTGDIVNAIRETHAIFYDK